MANVSCAFSGIDLVRDTRIALTSPANGATVKLPLTVEWREADRDVARDRVSYAVFVDRATIKRGETLEAVVPEDDTGCQRDPTCPDLDYLARHDVYVTTETSVVVPRVRDSNKTREAHRLTVIILLDGKRDGEGTFSRTFYVEGRE